MSFGHTTVAKVSSTNRSRITNDPRRLPGLDGRSAGARRRRDLINAFVAALGGSTEISPVKLAEVRRAAELVALAEESRATAFREGAGAVDMSALVRLEGMAARAQRALGLKQSPSLPWSPLRARMAAEIAAGDKPPSHPDKRATPALSRAEEVPR